MKEYTVSLKTGEEENSSSLRIIRDICKEHPEEEIDQVFLKTYKKINDFWEDWEEKECTLLYCCHQKINKGIKFKGVLEVE